MSHTTTAPEEKSSTPSDEVSVDAKQTDTKAEDEAVDDEPARAKAAHGTIEDEPDEPEAEEPSADGIEVTPTTEEALPEVPEGELPSEMQETAAPTDEDPSDFIDQPETAPPPSHDGGDRPEAHDFTATDGVPDLVDPYDSVDTTNPWDDTSSDADARWGRDSLSDIGVSQESMGDWEVYNDNSNGNTYTDYGNGTYEANVGGRHLTGQEAQEAFKSFTDTRLLTDEEFERLQENAYAHSPADDARSDGAGSPTGADVGGGDVGGSDADDAEQMGPPSSLAGGTGDGNADTIADFNGDGKIDLSDKIVHYGGRIFNGPAREQAREIDRQMGGTGQNDSTRGEQEAGARKEIDRQEKEAKADESERKEDDAAEEETADDAKDLDHPGWGDDRGGVSIFDSIKNQPGRADPRDPGNVDPHDDGYGDGGGDANHASSDDLKQPAGPDPEPTGSGSHTPTPEPIDYGPDHVDPIGSGPYDDDPINTGPGTVSLDQDDGSLYDAPIEMADEGHPELNDIDLFD